MCAMCESRDGNSKSSRLRQSEMSGFTLIELMLVVSIIAIISAAALPQVMTYLRTYRLNNDARSLIGEINIARLRASSFGGRAEVICDTSTTGPTALTCGIATRQLGATSFTGFQTGSLQETGTQVEMPTRIRLTGTDSFGFPSAATSGAGFSSTASGVTGQSGSAPFNCNAIVFNSRGFPIYDSLANIATTGVSNTCATVGSTDGQRKYNFVMYLQSGQTNYLAVVVDGSGTPSLWTWNAKTSSWSEFTD